VNKPPPPAGTKEFSVKQALQEAIQLQQQGKLDRAALLYQKILGSLPDHFDAKHLLGIVRAQQGRNPEALELIGAALKINPNDASALSNFGIVLQRLGRSEGGPASVKAPATKPDYVEALFNRGLALIALGRPDGALASFDKALAIMPDYVEALFNRGLALIALGRPQGALASFDKALAIKPDYVDALNNRGLVLIALGRPEGALASFEKALAIKPDYVNALNNGGVALVALKRPEDALANFDKALTIKPNYVEAWLNRGDTFFDCNLNNEAIESCERLLSIVPNSAPAQFASCMHELQILYLHEEEIARRRASYEQKLKSICKHVELGGLQDNSFEAVRSWRPFYLAYQGYNDRELQRLSGGLTCRIIGQAFPETSLPRSPAPNEPVRVGFVSGFFYLHSNWKIPLKGWMSQLDRRRFRIFGYHIGEKRDVETDIAAAMCDRFVHRSLTVEGWRQEILSDAPHVLIYPGLLMDEVSHRLAAQRLAAVQCNSWGHPETSGMPTLDYYLSSDLMEPPDATEHYTERLIRLPNLSIFYEPTETAPVSVRREELNFRSGATIFWCGQTLCKYLPQYDYAIAKIAKLVGNCQFVFLRHSKMQRITELFLSRLEVAFAQLDLKASDYIVMLNSLSASEFVAAINQCDIFLDSIGWSGCNSTMESLVCNLPIVTTPGPFMRGRHSSAILKMMDVTETIAESVEDYISIAARLANNPDERSMVSRKVADRKNRVYRDHECIAALEDFIDRAARGGWGL
jgi:predicted O-linked N-acetylglucosamine transferase (SPINDLY family)